MRKVNWLVNPFERVAGGQALLVGAAVALLTSALALPIDAHFPGVIDYKIGVAVPFLRLLLQNCIAVMDLTLAFYLGSLLANRRNLRLIDFLGTLALARFPYLLITAGLALFSAFGMFHIDVEAIKAGQGLSPAVIVSIIVTVPALIWLLALDFSALRVSSGMKGGKLWAVFIIGVIAAEALSIVLGSQLAV